MHKYKKVYIPTGESWEKEFTVESHPSQYDPYMTREKFLELVNSWNVLSIFQAGMDAYTSVSWIYAAL